jgi:hypothetical protein
LPVGIFAAHFFAGWIGVVPNSVAGLKLGVGIGGTWMIGCLRALNLYPG